MNLCKNYHIIIIIINNLNYLFKKLNILLIMYKLNNIIIMSRSENTLSLKNKYIKNFNPKFINDYFNNLNNIYHFIEYNNNNLNYNDEFYDKYLNCLLYCFTYLDNIIKFLINLPKGLYLNGEIDIDNYINTKIRAKDLIKKEIMQGKKCYHINLLLISYKKVNQLYNDLKNYLIEK